MVSLYTLKSGNINKGILSTHVKPSLKVDLGMIEDVGVSVISTTDVVIRIGTKLTVGMALLVDGKTVILSAVVVVTIDRKKYIPVVHQISVSIISQVHLQFTHFKFIAGTFGNVEEIMKIWYTTGYITIIRGETHSWWIRPPVNILSQLHVICMILR